MTSVQAGFAVSRPDVIMLNTSKLAISSLHEEPDELYRRVMDGQEKFLQSRYSRTSDTTANPTYGEYATVKVGGKTVAEIDNHGWVKTSNGLGGNLQNRLPGDINGQTGPVLAQARARAEIIAGLMGGKVEKSSTAMTQSQFMAVPRPRAAVDNQAMRKDPAYEQLQKTKEARKLFLAQQIAQSPVTEQDRMEAPSGDAATEFLDYMSKSPAERYYEALLREKGLTEEELANLPPEERARIVQEIKEEIEAHFAAKVEEKTGFLPLRRPAVPVPGPLGMMLGRA